MKHIFTWLKAISPILSVVSLVGCIALSVICISMNNKLKETINNYASEPFFNANDKEYTLLDILNEYGQQINNLYDQQQQILNNQSNIKNNLDRSNRFLEDYNASRFFEDDWPMDYNY